MEIKTKDKSDGIENCTIVKILFIISCATVTCMIERELTLLLIYSSIICTIVISSIFVFKHDYLTNIFNKMTLVNAMASIAFAITASYNFQLFTTSKISIRLIHHLSSIGLNDFYNQIALDIIDGIFYAIALFSMIIIFSHVLRVISEFIIKFYKTMDKGEKLYFFIVIIIAIISISILYSNTNVSYYPSSNGEVVDYDVVYTLDSGNLLKPDVFLNINADENSDFRQILFGVFAIPFGIGAKLLSQIIFFVPNSYPIILQIVQIIILSITLIMISRMMYLPIKQKYIFLILISTSYPVLLFAICVEQYIFSTFWLILMIYSSVFEKDKNNIKYQIIATGALVASSALLPILSKSRKVSDIVKEIIKFVTYFIITLFVFGRIYIISDLGKTINIISRFTGGTIGYKDRLLQYINFISTCFIKPNTIITENSHEYISYQLAKVTSINVLGLAIFIIILIGFIMNYKKIYAKICMYWICISIIVLVFIGWGAIENGFVLYSLYFSWAFISLFYLGITGLLKKTPKVLNAVLLLIIIAFATINIIGVFDIINFGMLFYPV